MSYAALNDVQLLLSKYGLGWCSSSFCGKCDTSSIQNFGRLSNADKLVLVESMANALAGWRADMAQTAGFIGLLSEAEVDHLVSLIAKRSFSDFESAWDFIRMSSELASLYRSCRGYRRHAALHKHRFLAPSLIRTAQRRNRRLEDALALLDFYRDQADAFPSLARVLPEWNYRAADTDRRRARELERLRIEEAQRMEKRSARLTELSVIARDGPKAILRALAAAESEVWDFPESWAALPNRDMRLVDENTLEQAHHRIPFDAKRCWRSLRHTIRGALKTQERARLLAKLQEIPIDDRLNEITRSEWSLTFFPPQWAFEAMQIANPRGSSSRPRIEMQPLKQAITMAYFPTRVSL